MNLNENQPEGIERLFVRVGLTIRRLRGEAGLTQSALAAACGVAQPTISLLEAGERGKQANLDTLTRMSQTMGLTLSEFFAEVEGADETTVRQRIDRLSPQTDS